MFLNITTEAFIEKPQNYSNLKFIQVETSIDGMAELIKKGHGFTSLYNAKNLVTKTKNKTNWKETWFLGYDIDKVNVSMDELYEKLSVKPSISYTTPSNEKEEGIYCYRLVYVLDKPINNIDEFKYYYLSFSEYLGISKLIDNKAKDCTRYFNGSYNCKQIINKEQVIDLSKYSLKEYSENCRPYNKKKNELYYVDCEKQNDIKCDETIKRDFYKLDYIDFYEKYMNKFPNRERTYIEHTEDDPIIYIPKGYLEIIRTFAVNKTDKGVDYHQIIWKDGQNRGKKLLCNMTLRRFITPSLTIEGLLYCIAYEITHNFDNRDGGLTKSRMFSIAAEAMSVDLSLPNKLKDEFYTSKKWYVNKEYCIKYNVSVKQVRNEQIAKSRSKDPLIEAFYENGLTAKEVHDIIIDNGHDIDISTVYRWFKKYVPKVTDDMIYDMIDDKLSVEENEKMLRGRGLKFDNNKFSKMVKEKKNMKETKKIVFESDEEMFRFQQEMMANKMKREEKYNTSKDADTSVPETLEPLSAIDPTTIKVEEKEAIVEQKKDQEDDMELVEYLDKIEEESIVYVDIVEEPSKVADTSVPEAPEPLSAITPTTTHVEEKQAVVEEKKEEHSKTYYELLARIKDRMTWHEKDTMISNVRNEYIFFKSITKEEFEELMSKLNKARVYTISI